MRWLRRGLVALLLAAPVVVVAVLAWPEEDDAGGAGGDAAREEGSGPDGALVAGDEIDGELGFGETAVYRLVGDGSLRIDVHGNPPMDATLTVRNGAGDELAFNDDTNGLDPQVSVDVADGDDLVVEVRDLGGNAATFVLAVE